MDKMLAGLQNPNVQEQHALMSWWYNTFDLCISENRVSYIDGRPESILNYKHNYFYIHIMLVKSFILFFYINMPITPSKQQPVKMLRLKNNIYYQTASS